MTLFFYVLLGAFLLFVVGARMRRMMQSRPLNLRSLWVLPALVLGGFLLNLKSHPVVGAGWIWTALGFIVGAGLGWFRAKTIRLTIEPITRQVMAQGSAMTIVFLLALVAGRVLLRVYFNVQAASHPAAASSVDAAFLALALGVLVTRAVELTLRARGLAGVSIGPSTVTPTSP